MFTDTAKNLIEAIKLSPRYLLPIWIFTGIVVFAPKGVLSIFGLTDIVSSYRPYFGLAFLLSGALLASSACIAFYHWTRARRRERRVRRYQHQRLNNLTEDEKELLRGFIHNQTRTQYLSMSDGRVGQLQTEKILFRASNLGQYMDFFAYNIQPWAWDYLNKHPELLEPTPSLPDHDNV